MTAEKAFLEAALQLRAANIDDARFDCEALFSFYTGISKSKRIMYPEAKLKPSEEKAFFEAVHRRISGEPLQYILGEWDFMNFTFRVGEGVLIPRPETEMLVEAALRHIETIENPVVYDLCAGSGCIGLSVAKLCPNARVYLFEKYNAAKAYLDKNLALLGADNAVSLSCDIFDGVPQGLPAPDVLLSNPPYIDRVDMLSLQPEVQKEPSTALFGGEDGLDFYRAIINLWLPLLKAGGMAAMECGDGQTAAIKSMCSGKFPDINILYDFNHIDRAVQIKV